MAILHVIGGIFATVALVPAPREQAWRDGTCAFAGKEVRFVRDAALPPEGYRLDIAPDGVTVASVDEAGAFYARQTLKQLTGRTSFDIGQTNRVTAPCGTVTDYPTFRWRGFMLDEGRHFFGKETVKNLLDLMAEHKLNVFHWHLTEDQGWRLDLPRFPELVQYGATRPVAGLVGNRRKRLGIGGDGKAYGPLFYTAKDIGEILAYAKERFITVVPEIEIPGHIRALLAAHPEFACREGLERVPRIRNNIEVDVLCAGNDEAIRFMEQVYDEVCALFPGTYVHIGGDECPKKRWKECPKCQARIKSLGLKDEDGLQAWVTRHFTEYLAKKGRRAIGWDEVLAGDPGVETVVQAWRKPEYSVRAAEKGHSVVVSTFKSTYFSIPQGVKEDPFEYLSPNLRCTLATAYAFDPFTGLSKAAQERVLGAECCMWSESVWNEYDLSFKLWPRACAFAETVWTAPAAPRDFEDFKRRMEVHRRRLIADGVNCAPVE